MIDLHTHSLFSDGALLVSELIRRADDKGYKAIAITDHMDASNMDFVIPRIVEALAGLSKAYPHMKLIPGAEITHVPPEMIGPMVSKARQLGTKLVVVHGETLVEPVLAGTNRAAIEAAADILSHPGLLTGEEAALAAEMGVALEISYRKGHCLSNGHVAKTAREAGADLILNTDAHGPGDLITEAMAEKVLMAAGLTKKETFEVFEKTKNLIEKID